MVQSYTTAADCAPQSRQTETLADRLEKPLLDDRTYRVIRLPNKLEVLLIHDPDTDKASAAMDVDVGSLMDDDDMPGMAHAVEHLLFMGTEKYPGENEYNSYLTKYGGSSNAFTASTSTNYYFELSASSKSNSPGPSAASSKVSTPVPKEQAPLYGALDIFAQFFVKPLFLADTLDRELRAVDSENKKNLQSDNWRLHQLNKTLSSKDHPYHHFSTGNYQVLHDEPLERGVKIREAFIQFYEKNYSANRMKLVVLGREGLDQLQDWVEELFSAVPNQDLNKNRWDGIQALGPDELCTQIFCKPVMDMRELQIYFTFPDQEDLYESSPSRYIAHLIGHEGPGSLFEYLKSKGWANGLNAGPRPLCPGTAFFTLSVKLTEDGLKNYQDVIKHCFQYIAMLKDNPPYEWIVDEMAKLAEVEFKYMQKIPASRTTSHLGGIMQKPFPRDALLSAQSLIKKFDAKAISEGLSWLRPDNFRFILVSKEVPGDWPDREKWYGTEYKYEKIPQSFLGELQKTVTEKASARPKEMHLPGRNEFVPQRLDVEKKETDNPLLEPKLVRNDENVRIWFKKDDRFWVPKANINVCLRNPIIYTSPLNYCMAMLYKELVDDVLSNYSYDAELAGLDYSFMVHSTGLDLTVAGYNDKMPVLLEKVLLSMRDLEIRDDRFEIIKDRRMRSFKNFEFTEPFRQIHTYARWLISDRHWMMQELLEVLPSITADDVRSFFPQILRQMHIETLVHGNLYKEDALNVANLIEKILKPRALPVSQWTTPRFLDMPAGSNYVYERELGNPDNLNHCIDYYLPVGTNIDRSTRAKLLLLGQMADEPCFDTLRTKEQLGYVVGSGVNNFGTVAGYMILIQSERDCAYLEQRIDAFLVGFQKTLQDMPQDEFEAHKVGVINKRLEKLKNLNSETGRFWVHIAKEDLDFEQSYHDAESVEQTTKEDMLEFFNTYISPTSATRKKCAVHLVAKASSSTATDSNQQPQDPAALREKLSQTLSQLFTKLSLPIEPAIISSHLEKIDISAGDRDSIASAVGSALSSSGALGEDKIKEVVEQGKAALGQILPTLGISAKSITETNGEVNGNAGEQQDAVKVENPNKVVQIEDVKAFKASIPISAGPAKAKEVHEFEELGAKL
ncbi:LuxS/MPP-like metallohydrolase [Polychaeton citri CBS 116435]|uniref:LuxS/MPP-like metallohydrolase n=1 Tax=Polychaeton citri CBS 116435 TaxID=1314669 RepID=A0A9P4QA09_9PEZI|nr:LuxS/MPP-like metallohydrolase [Polychaeton citri CBS 116435]